MHEKPCLIPVMIALVTWLPQPLSGWKKARLDLFSTIDPPAKHYMYLNIRWSFADGPIASRQIIRFSMPNMT